MTNVLLFDLSRVLLHPKDKNYTGSLNSLYRSLLKQENYNFFEHFELNDELLEFLKTIKASYGIYILTSEVIQSAPEIRGKLDEVFDDIYSAQDIGLSKKDPEIYQLISKKLQRLPNEVIFIDDIIENIIPAAKAGLQTIHYVSNKQLLENLKNL